MYHTPSPFAFCLIHFGKNPIYLEYELYFLLNLRQHTSYDILYLYSIADTPESYPRAVKNLNIPNLIISSYDDTYITYKIENYKSVYEHFNVLRVCNYIFAFEHMEYKKICVVESDLVIVKNIDSIFTLKSPAILFYPSENQYENSKLKITDKKLLLKMSISKSFVNGGVLLFSPSRALFKKSKDLLHEIIREDCIYPNETLFLVTMRNLHNLPIHYNMSTYHLHQKYEKPIHIYHFNNTIYKPLNMIKDDWINKDTKILRKKIVLFYKKEIYNRFKRLVQSQI